MRKKGHIHAESHIEGGEMTMTPDEPVITIRDLKKTYDGKNYVLMNCAAKAILMKLPAGDCINPVSRSELNADCPPYEQVRCQLFVQLI